MKKPRSISLNALRAKIDTLDTRLHDLLMKRADIVTQVAEFGGKARSPLRPGREAQILYRLLQRHREPMPKQAVVRIWRELLAGSSLQQGGFTIAVADTDNGQYLQVAREHFGALTPMRVFPTTAQTINDVLTGQAAAAVVPLPTGQADPRGTWWAALPYGAAIRPYVVARLPFWAAPRAEGTPSVQAMVISTVPPDPGEDDHSLIFVEGPDSTRVTTALNEAGFTPHTSVLARHGNAVQILADIPGFVTTDDPRLARLAAAGVTPPVILGAYARSLVG